MKNGQLATLAALSLIAMEDVPKLSPSQGRHSQSRGRVIGWDGGKGRKRQPRNSPCTCGSGKKAKKCCVFMKEQEVEQTQPQ